LQVIYGENQGIRRAIEVAVLQPVTSGNPVLRILGQ
jgi:hypothetical protein